MCLTALTYSLIVAHILKHYLIDSIAKYNHAAYERALAKLSIKISSSKMGSEKEITNLREITYKIGITIYSVNNNSMFISLVSVL